MTDKLYDESKSIFENAIGQVMDGILVDDEVHIPANKTRDYNLFKDPNDYNLINNAFLNKNVNPYIVNYQAWQKLGDKSAATRDSNATGRVQFENYNYGEIVEELDDKFNEGVTFAEAQSQNMKLDPESRAWWEKRHKFVKDKWNNDKRDSYMYQAGSWIGQTDDVLSDSVKFGYEGVVNLGINLTDLVAGYGPRLVNHLSLNLAENAFNMAFFPADYADQKRVNKLPEDEKRFSLDIMPGKGELLIPSAAGFDGSFNDFFGKNWGKGQGIVIDRAKELFEQSYSSRLMGDGNIRGAAEITREFISLGKFGKGAKIVSGKNIINNPKLLKEYETIWKRTWQELKRDGGLFKGTYKYLKGRRGKSNVNFVEDSVAGAALQRRYDMATHVVGWGFGAENYLFDSKYSSIPLPTKGLPLFEFDTPLGIVMAPFLATAGTFTWRNTGGQIPQAYAHFQMNQIARGFKIGTREYGLGFVGPKMDMQTASSRYLLRSGRVTPDQIKSIDKGINGFNMEGKDRAAYDASRGVVFKAEDFLFTEWMAGRLTDKRRVEATYSVPTDRQAINSFNTKMDLLNLDKRTARAQHDMFIVYDKMSKEGSPLAQRVLEHTKTAIDTQDRIINALMTPEGQIRPRYKGIIEPSQIGPLYSQFDTMTNLSQASAYRKIITEAGDLGPFGNRVDTILLNDLEIMANQEENALLNHANVLSTIVKTLNQNEAVVNRVLPPEDPLKVFLRGSQEALQNQQESFTKHRADLEILSSKLAVIADAGVDYNLSSISSKLGEANFEKPKSLVVYENNYNNLTSKDGPDQDGYVKLGVEARAIADKRHDDIYGKEGIIAKAYNITRTKIDKTNQEFPSLNFQKVGEEGLRGFTYEANGFATQTQHVIQGSDINGYTIGRYGGDTGFVQNETVFPDRFAVLKDAELEVQSFENNAYRKTNPSETVTVPKPLQETLNNLEIESGVNVFTNENGKNVLQFSGVSPEGTRIKKDIIRGLRITGVLEKYGGAKDPSYIPPKVNVDDLILARSAIVSMIYKDGAAAKASGLSDVATTITEVLNKIPGYQKANETYAAYAKVWKNDFGAMLTEQQPGGNKAMSEFTLMESFIKYGIQQPPLAAENAFAYFGPTYKEMIARGFAYGIDNNRFDSKELLKAKPFLKELFNYNIATNSRGEVIRSRIGKEVEKIKGKGGEIQTLIDTSGILKSELKLDANTRKANEVKAIQDSENAQIQLDKVIFSLSGGEERVVPFIKDFAGKSVSAMNNTALTIIDNSSLTMAQVKDGLLTGLKETLINDLVYGSELSMKPAEVGASTATLQTNPKENVAVIQGQNIPTPSKIIKELPAEPVVEEGSRPSGARETTETIFSGDMDRLSLGIPTAMGGKGIFNQKGYISFQDENILKQLNNKKLEWTDVLKGWTTALNTSLLENGNLIEFLSTGEGAVTYLTQDVKLLNELKDTQKNALDINLTLAKNPSRRPVNIPRKWTSAQITGWTNTYMKRITSRTYALGYASFQGMKMRNARMQVRMLTDPAVRESMQLVFRGKADMVSYSAKQSVKGLLVYLLPTVAELYPEERDEEQLAEYEKLRKETILEMLRELNLEAQAKRKENITEDQMKSLNLN